MVQISVAPQLPVKSIPQLFREAGYHVSNGSGAASTKNGKTDYNFVTKDKMYDGGNWREALKADKPFFAQIQLKGGKNRNKRQSEVDPAAIKLPPYYPDHPVLREDWSEYLKSWIDQDRQVGAIMDTLKQAGAANKTVVFFLTDHGVSHARGKQFLYEEGIRVPLIVKFPDGRAAGSVRDDLAIHLDLAASSLALAGIEIPERVQGMDLFAPDYRPREQIFSARDRCDETVEFIRAVRTKRFKYIRNFLSHLPHLQPNQYKDGKPITKTIRQLHVAGELNDLQSRLLVAPRPREELYDLTADPHETVNLATNPMHAKTLSSLRNSLTDWMIESRDLGVIPEPLLEDFGRDSGNKYAVLQSKLARGTVPNLLRTLEAVAAGETSQLNDPSPSIRYWAATRAGIKKDQSTAPKLRRLLIDEWEPVRIAAALALCRLGKQEDRAIDLLAGMVDSRNHITGMYAIRAIEWSGIRNEATRVASERAAKSQYEFTRRIGRRLQSEH